MYVTQVPVTVHCKRSKINSNFACESLKSGWLKKLGKWRMRNFIQNFWCTMHFVGRGKVHVNELEREAEAEVGVGVNRTANTSLVSTSSSSSSSSTLRSSEWSKANWLSKGHNHAEWNSAVSHSRYAPKRPLVCAFSLACLCSGLASLWSTLSCVWRWNLSLEMHCVARLFALPLRNPLTTAFIASLIPLEQSAVFSFSYCALSFDVAEFSLAFSLFHRSLCQNKSFHSPSLFRFCFALHISVRYAVCEFLFLSPWKSDRIFSLSHIFSFAFFPLKIT